jgi:hypothetical protein
LSLSFTAWCCVGERRAAVSSVFRAVPSFITDQRTSIAEAGLERFFLFFARPPVNPLNRAIREHLMVERWRKGRHGEFGRGRDLRSGPTAKARSAERPRGIAQAYPEQRPQLPGFSKWAGSPVGTVNKKLPFLAS